MALVKAPNGDVYDLSDSVASGLIGADGNGWSAAKSAPSGRGGKGKADVSVEPEAVEPEASETVEPVEAETVVEADK